jgi:hypothetical protein
MPEGAEAEVHGVKQAKIQSLHGDVKTACFLPKRGIKADFLAKKGPIF